MFGEKPLGIFKNDVELKESIDILGTWSYLQARELKLAVTHPPANYFQKMALWTEQGKLWKFPIDNEQGTCLISAPKKMDCIQFCCRTGRRGKDLLYRTHFLGQTLGIVVSEQRSCSSLHGTRLCRSVEESILHSTAEDRSYQLVQAIFRREERYSAENNYPSRC